MAESLLVQLRKGALDLCVLALLAQDDSYAYEIASRLADGIGDAGTGFHVENDRARGAAADGHLPRASARCRTVARVGIRPGADDRTVSKSPRIFPTPT